MACSGKQIINELTVYVKGVYKIDFRVLELTGLQDFYIFNLMADEKSCGACVCSLFSSKQALFTVILMN